MALMPPGESSSSYLIVTFEDLQRAIARAPYDFAAARAVRDFMMEAHYYRQVSGGMTPTRYHIALDELKQLQATAAEHGFDFTLETNVNGHRTLHYPPEVAKRAIEPKKPLAPEGVHFTSHPRVGDEVKDTYVEHIHEMFAGGYIDQPEHDARIDALMLARTREEMTFLTQDLPEPPAKTPDVIEQKPPRISIDGPAAFLVGAVAAMSTAGLLVLYPGNIFSMVAIMVLIALGSACSTLWLFTRKK